MNAQDLKNSILQLAIQGKLVEQRPEEGTAEELYKKIQEEKKKLIKEGKIKKTKALPEIIEDEIPFDIPENWKWVRIAEMSYFQEGPGILAKDFRDFGIPLIRIAGMQRDILSLEGCNYLEPEMVEKKWNHFKLDLGDILISTSASMDKICIVTKETVGAIPYTGQIRFKMYGNILKKYFIYFLMSNAYLRQINEQKSGGIIKHYGPTHLKKMIIPLPPLEEQKRIVAKIEDLMPFVDKYDAAYSELEELNKKFPEDMQKSILQYAIQGKLVEQRKGEGTAEELYNQIQEEKKKLIKEGKIKKTKALPEITEDEIPFDIPENWKWVRLSEVIDVRDGTHDTPQYVLEGIPLVTSKNLTNGEINFENIKYISDEDAEKINQRSGVDNGDILFAMIGSIGNPVLVKKIREFSIKNMALFKTINSELFTTKYLFWFLQFEQGFMKKKAAGGVQSFISLTFLRSYLFPLPPLKEQKRIVAKLEELLPYTKQLVK